MRHKLEAAGMGGHQLPGPAHRTGGGAGPYDSAFTGFQDAQDEARFCSIGCRPQQRRKWGQRRKQEAGNRGNAGSGAPLREGQLM